MMRVTVQQHPICFAAALLLNSYIPWFSFNSGIKLAVTNADHCAKNTLLGNGSHMLKAGRRATKKLP